jgi:hypothetical protein
MRKAVPSNSLSKRHNTEKWLVKTSESIDGKGVEESLVKVVSLNFFCI